MIHDITETKFIDGACHHKHGHKSHLVSLKSPLHGYVNIVNSIIYLCKYEAKRECAFGFMKYTHYKYE